MSSPRLSIQALGSTRLGPAGAVFTGFSLNALDHFQMLFNMEIGCLYQGHLCAAASVIPVPGVLQLLPALEGNGAIQVNAFLPRRAVARLDRHEWQEALYEQYEHGES